MSLVSEAYVHYSLEEFYLLPPVDYFLTKKRSKVCYVAYLTYLEHLTNSSESSGSFIYSAKGVSVYLYDELISVWTDSVLPPTSQFNLSCNCL